MTFQELLESQNFADPIKGRESKWTERFRKVIDKAGVAAQDVSDPDARSKVAKTTTWNWVAALLTPYYGAYHGISNWAVYIAVFAAANFLDTVILGGAAILPIMIGFLYVFGAYGNSWVLLRTIDHCDGKPPMLASKPLRLTASIVGIFITMSIAIAI